MQSSRSIVGSIFLISRAKTSWNRFNGHWVSSHIFPSVGSTTSCVAHWQASLLTKVVLPVPALPRISMWFNRRPLWLLRVSKSVYNNNCFSFTHVGLFSSWMSVKCTKKSSSGNSFGIPSRNPMPPLLVMYSACSWFWHWASIWSSVWTARNKIKKKIENNSNWQTYLYSQTRYQ